MDAKTFTSRGDKLLELKRYKSAIDEYMAALALDINNTYSYQQISKCYLHLNNREKSLEYAEKGLESDPSSSYSYYLVAFIKNYYGQYLGAEKLINKAIEISPDVSFYYGCLARSLYGSYDYETRPENYEYAINAALNGLKINPKDLTCLNVLVSVYAHLNDIGRFYQYMKPALAEGGNDPYTHLEVGTSFFIIKNYEKAKIHLTTALRLNPGLRSAKDLLQKINKNRISRRYSTTNIILFIIMFLFCSTLFIGVMIYLTVLILF